jgi:cobalt/nickel transport protein
MKNNWTLELIALIAVIGFCGVFLYTSSTMAGAEFAGSDNVGSAKIVELTGHPIESFAPLIPQYVPPSGEIEATLFALQAAFGGVVLGLIFGYWLGQRKTSSAT